MTSVFLLGFKQTLAIMSNGFMQNDVVNLKFKMTITMAYFVENVGENDDDVLRFVFSH